MIEALTWALELDPATLKWPAAVLVALCFGLVLFGQVQYQAFNRLWGIQLVLGLAGGAVVAGLGAGIHWLLGMLYGVGYLLTWLVWVLTRRLTGWRQHLLRGPTPAIVLGPWLWLGATEKGSLSLLSAQVSDLAKWLLMPSGLIRFWMLLGALWMLVLVGGWGCWRWPVARPGRRRWLVAAWAVLGVLGLNWYAAGRLDLYDVCQKGQNWRPGYVLVSRPGSQWYRDNNGWTPMHWAAWNGHDEAIRLLLAAGAAANVRDNYGLTPLDWAAWNGHAEAIKVLLTAGADVNANADDGWTPLRRAADSGDADAIRLLLAARADVHAKTKDGRTPLHLAAYAGHAEAIKVLLAAGARVNERDSVGKTALDEAKNDSCRDLLRQAGGKTGEELDAEKAAPPP